MEKIHDLAERMGAIAAANGFDLPTWDNLPSKVMFAVTELNEACDYVKGRGKEPVEEELADTAIRILSVMNGLWGRNWSDRILPHFTPRMDQKFRHIEEYLWPIVGHLCNAVEFWRHDKESDTQVCLEMALKEIFRVASIFDCDLWEKIVWKAEKNEKRAYLHGKVQTAG